MSDLQKQASILAFIDIYNITYMCVLRRRLKKSGKQELVYYLDENKDFSDKVKNLLFRIRIGEVVHE